MCLGINGFFLSIVVWCKIRCVMGIMGIGFISDFYNDFDSLECVFCDLLLMRWQLVVVDLGY